MKIENFVTPITFFLMFLWIIGTIIMYITDDASIIQFPMIATIVYGIIKAYEADIKWNR